MKNLNRIKKAMPFIYGVALAVFTGLFVFALMTATTAKATTNTDWHDDDVSTQISKQERARMRAEWMANNGQYQKDLSQGEFNRLAVTTEAIQNANTRKLHN